MQKEYEYFSCLSLLGKSKPPCCNKKNDDDDGPIESNRMLLILLILLRVFAIDVLIYRQSMVVQATFLMEPWAPETLPLVDRTTITSEQTRNIHAIMI